MKTKLLRKETVAEGTMRFWFLKPVDFSYRAGQTIDLTLENPAETDAEGNTRTFSLVSAPHESELSIATRLRDTAFKRTLRNMREGSELSFEGPIGNFVLHENVKRSAVILAGGIGVTPFRSMIVDVAYRKLPHFITLLFSNRRPEDSPFLDELQAIPKSHPNITVIPTMTEVEKSKLEWKGETGYLDATKLEKYVDKNREPIYYIAGPLQMVKAMHELLLNTGVSNDDIRIEEFTGY